MDVRPELQLQSMIKAMTDIVLPAVDADNRLAQEQAHLVIATLQLVANRLPIAYRYDRDELERYVGLSRDLLAAVGGTVGAAAVAPTTPTPARRRRRRSGREMVSFMAKGGVRQRADVGSFRRAAPTRRAAIVTRPVGGHIARRQSRLT